jgi:hypothetical protein
MAHCSGWRRYCHAGLPDKDAEPIQVNGKQNEMEGQDGRKRPEQAVQSRLGRRVTTPLGWGPLLKELRLSALRPAILVEAHTTLASRYPGNVGDLLTVQYTLGQRAVGLKFNRLTSGTGDSG